MTEKSFLIISEKEYNMITLNRPRTLNSFSIDMISSLIDILKQWEKENNDKPLIITGKGRAFSSGGNLEYMKNYIDKGEPEKYLEMIVPEVNKLIQLIINYNGATLAILNGDAVGGGLNLALACDFRIVNERAKFRFGFTDIGLTPATGNSFFLPRIIGIPKTLQLCLFNEKITAKEMFQMNIVHAVYSEEESEVFFTKWINKLLELNSWQVRETRKLLFAGMSSDLDEHLIREFQTIIKAGTRSLFSEKVNERWKQIQTK